MDPLTILLLGGAAYGGYRYVKTRQAPSPATQAAAPAAVIPRATSAQMTLVASSNVASPAAVSSPVRATRADTKGLFASHLFDAV